MRDTQKVRTVGEEMLGIATRTLNPEFAGRARYVLGASFSIEGSLTAATEQMELACALSAGVSPIHESMGWDLRSRARIASAFVCGRWVFRNARWRGMQKGWRLNAI